MQRWKYEKCNRFWWVDSVSYTDKANVIRDAITMQIPHVVLVSLFFCLFVCFASFCF